MRKSIKVDPELWKRIEQYARKAGYSSPEEFVEHALNRELARLEEAEDREQVEKRLKGLGYIE